MKKWFDDELDAREQKRREIFSNQFNLGLLANNLASTHSAKHEMRWLRLSEQIIRLDKWNVCRG
jgi:hypothetical protein